MDEKLINVIKSIFSDKSALPKRDKVQLTTRQKDAIKLWKRPLATFTKTCSKCGQCYSAGYLKICPEDPEWFCERLDKIITPECKGFTDEELGFYFGLERKDLDE